MSVGLGPLTALATGVGIYADVHDGESTGQAVVSQGVGLAAGARGAWAAGAGAGALIGGPPGSVTGVVVVGGAQLVGGTIAALAGDELIDRIWPGDGDSDDEPSAAEQHGGTLLEYAAEVTTPERETNRGGAR